MNVSVVCVVISLQYPN